MERTFTSPTVDNPPTTPPRPVDNPLPLGGRPAPERGNRAHKRGQAKTPHVAFTRHEQPLHVVFSGLTHGDQRRTVSWSTDRTETPTQFQAGTVRRSGAAPRTSVAATARTMRQLPGDQHRHDGGERQMARGLGNSSPVMDEKTPAKADRATTKTHRHAGPYGASFDGTERDGKTPVRGLTFERRWTRPDVHPYDEITWEYRTAGIANESGKSVFEQKDVEVPDFWSQLATNVVVSKYFRGHLGTPERETSVRQLIDRVVNTIA